jgi:hypothetical protein
MKHTLLAVSAALVLFSGSTDFPAVVSVTPALAQGGDVLVQDGLWLPRSHRYELYNPENAVYGAVPVDTVSSYVRQGRWIYDRTAEAWVSHPSVGQPNPQFAASGRAFHPPYAAGERDPRREELLGQLEVDLRADRDVIEVAPDEGRFQKIRIVVRGAPIQLHDMKVTFADDSVFDPVGRDRILQEDSAYVFDLPGQRRMIKRITFLYRSIDRREGKATVFVYGER